jgi:hypothetical protein
MKSRILLTAAVALALILSSAPALSEHHEKEMSPEEKAMMEAWMAYATPGEPHKMLAERVGSWTYTSKMWAHPGAEPEESSGTAKLKMIMDGRYLVEKNEGNFQGMPFTGLGITGYDNMNKEFRGFWIDSFSTGIFTSHGTCDESWETCTYYGKAPDPMSGKNKKIKMVDRKVDADTYVMEMYDKTPDGKEFLHFVLTYKRTAE